MKCADCKWWEKFMGDDLKNGRCHRFPPAINPHCQCEYLHPVTRAHDWCGEFSPSLKWDPPIVGGE
jgi:hypothetical protein